MDYVGTLYNDGTEFDKGSGFEFTVGGYQVIQCWNTAVLNKMKTGEKAKVFCPAKTAYGKKASGKIPADSDLVFMVTVKKCVDMFA
jgi:FKBP-type peptidyl-prolyl cis-trans isomerase FkpA